MKYDFEIENDENYQNSSLKKFWHGLNKNAKIFIEIEMIIKIDKK